MALLPPARICGTEKHPRGSFSHRLYGQKLREATGKSKSCVAVPSPWWPRAGGSDAPRSRRWHAAQRPAQPPSFKASVFLCYEEAEVENLTNAVPSSELWVQRLQNASRNRLFPLLLPWRRYLHPQHKSQLQEAASNVQVTASPLKFHPITHNPVTGFREGRIDPPISPDLSPLSNEPIERKLQLLPFPPRSSVPSICR